MLKVFISFLLSVLVLTSCNVSFPKDTLEEDAVKLIKKETQKDTKAYKVGSTLYLDICFEDLVTNDKQKIAEIYDTLQKIVSNVVRITLSSDADIDFVVVSAFDPDYQTLLRVFENVDDIKKYSHQYISREDYSERQLMEFAGPDSVKEIVNDKHDISKEEYVARLSAFQLSQSNPVLSKLIQVFELKFSHIENNTFYFVSEKTSDNKDVIKVLEKMLEQEIRKNLKKYELYSIKSAILLCEDGTVVFDVVFDF